jgi:flap endonuclease-1
LGVQIGDLINRKKISLSYLARKSLAIDAYNMLYQFLSIIRGFDGRPLMDKNGRVTSHLSGLIYRTANLIEIGIKPIYIFDGKPPTLKETEIKRRMKIKKEALTKYKKALKKRKFKEAKIYAQATSTITEYMVEDSKTLLSLIGVPWVQAPSEGEAQASYMASKGDVWAASSQDYDSLLFGAPRLVRNISITGKRKLPRKKAYVEILPEIIELERVLKELRINRLQLISLGILTGTDFNPDGVTGIGPKTALSITKKYRNIKEIVTKLQIEDQIPVDPEKIVEIFLNPTVTDDYKLEWKKPNVDKTIEFLCAERSFSENRVMNALEKTTAGFREIQDKTTLEKWLT